MCCSGPCSMYICTCTCKNRLNCLVSVGSFEIEQQAYRIACNTHCTWTVKKNCTPTHQTRRQWTAKDVKKNRVSFKTKPKTVQNYVQSADVQICRCTEMSFSSVIFHFHTIPNHGNSLPSQSVHDNNELRPSESRKCGSVANIIVHISTTCTKYGCC